MMTWLSHEMVQGLGFNAGSTFDPPREILDRRLQPDISVGGGTVPLDKSKFPTPETPALQELHAENIFPSKVMFPNLAMHLRAGLPWRSDFAIRFADMTTPPGYKISATTTGKGQSNSIGFSLRKHFFGEAADVPMLTLGAHYNHVYGRFTYATKFNVDNVQGFSANSDVNGGIYWSVNSYGLNAVVSQQMGALTPFLGFGYNYVTGSVRANLTAVPSTPLITPIMGESTEKPEQNQGRVLFGAQLDHSWVNFFTSGEIKAIGIGSGKSWIVHAGMSLPFHIGTLSERRAAKLEEERQRRLAAARRDDDEPAVARIRPAKASRAPAPRPRREIFSGTPSTGERSEGSPTMIFIQ